MINDKIARALALFTSCFLATEAFSSTPGETTSPLGEDTQKAPSVKPQLQEKPELPPAQKVGRETARAIEDAKETIHDVKKGFKDYKKEKKKKKANKNK